MKKNKWMLMGAGAAMMLMAACGTSRQVQGTGKVDAGKQQTSVKADEQGESFSQRAFLQMVSDIRSTPRILWARWISPS